MAAITISIAGIIVPFFCGFVLGQFLPENLLPHPEQRLVVSLFLGTALSISSVKIVAVVVREMKFMRRNVGQIIIATAVIDDTIGWIIGAVAELVGIEGGVVSGVINLESSGVEASDWRPRHDEQYNEAYRAVVGALVEQAGVDFGGSLIGKARRAQKVAHSLSVPGGRRALWARAG